MKRLPVILGLMCFIWCCSPALYKPISTNADEQKKLMAGRALYIEKCSGCHNLHLPQSHTAAEWKKNLDEMQQRSKVSEAEKQAIYDYLTYVPK